MTPDEAKKYLIEKVNEEVIIIRDMLEEYRRDKGLPINQFIEILATVVQDYRLIYISTGG